MDHTKPWLKFIDAAEVSDQTLDLNHLKVRNRSGEDLGVVDGLVYAGFTAVGFAFIEDIGYIAQSFGEGTDVGAAIADGLAAG